jgi:hypothetical protein
LDEAMPAGEGVAWGNAVASRDASIANFEFKQGSVCGLSFADASFDTVFSQAWVPCGGATSP